MPKSKEAFDAMRESTRQKIEATALSLFARKGLSVTISEIAKAGGLSQGLLYSHYPSKDALIAGLVQQAVEISSQSIQEISACNLSTAEKIQKISAMMCHMFIHQPQGIDYFMFMLQVSISGFPVPAQSDYNADAPNPLECLAKMIIQGQKEGSIVEGTPINLAALYWATIQGLCCYANMGVSLWPEPKSLSRILLKEDFL